MRQDKNTLRDIPLNETDMYLSSQILVSLIYTAAG